MKLYLAGPMTGLPEFNFPAFSEAAHRLRSLGHQVWSPAEHDIKLDGFDPNHGEHAGYAHYMKRDLPAVCDADAVAVLPGWEESQGSRMEVHICREIGHPVLDATSLQPICDEVRTTDPDTGGQKGTKLERFDLIPVEPLREIALVYGRGAKKYAEDNWRKGYSWRLSFAALMRHAWAFWKGESRDELGNHHLAAVAWHCLTLMWFEKHRPEKDDRCDK